MIKVEEIVDKMFQDLDSTVTVQDVVNKIIETSEELEEKMLEKANSKDGVPVEEIMKNRWEDR